MTDEAGSCIPASNGGINPIHRQLAFSSLIMGGSNIVKAAVQLVSLPLIARLLGPAEYGLYGLAMPAILLMLTIADSGLGASLARESEKNIKIWSSAFWFVNISGVILAFGLSGASFVMAGISHQPRLPPIMMSLSLCLIFLTLSVTSNARLTRQGRMGVNSIGEALGTIIGAAVAIFLALRGAGTWSLVAQTLLTFGIRAVFVMVSAPFIPQLHFALKDLHAHLKVGGSILGTKLVATAGKATESTMIVRLINTKFLGVYSFANQAPMYICETISNALWAVLYSQGVLTDDDAAIQRTYAVVVRVFSLSVFPLVVLVAAQAHQLILSLLGPHWLLAVPIMQILLITYPVTVSGGFGSALLYARGLSYIQLRIFVESAIMRIIFVALVPWTGVLGMAIGFGAVNIFFGVRSIFSVQKYLGYSALPQFKIMAGPAAASAAAGLLSWYIGYHVPASIWWTIPNIVACFAVYCAVLGLIEYQAVIDDIVSLKKLMGRNKTPQAA